MKTPLLSIAILLVASGSIVSCTSGNQRMTWNRIQSKGLFPAMFHPVNGVPKSVIGMSPEQRMHAYESSVVTNGMRGSPIPKLAKMVPGKAGYVKTPYTLPERTVDVRDCQPGALKKCPYTGRYFVVPPTSGAAPVVKQTVTPVVVKPKTTSTTSTVKSTPKPKPVTDTATVAPKPQTPPTKPETPTTTEPKPAPPTTTPKETPPPSVPDKPATPEVKPTPKPETTVAPPNPLGSPVPGRPGYVYSPYGNKSQLVDVQGMKPGTLVRCPYSGKLFRVP